MLLNKNIVDNKKHFFDKTTLRNFKKQKKTDNKYKIGQFFINGKKLKKSCFKFETTFLVLFFLALNFFNNFRIQ